MKTGPSAFGAFFCLVLHAQAPSGWPDDLVNHLAGSWKIEGNVLGKPAHHDVQADWVFNRQFLRVTERTSRDAPPGESKYDAVWYLGWDGVSERYVLHLMDTFGGRFSETLGYGTCDGNQIRFVFEYPDGPFHNTYRWNPADRSWRWLLEQKDKDGKWASFADLRLTPAAQSGN